MKRPGNLRGNGLGMFGKSAFIPPPPPPKPGEFVDGRWACDQATKPQAVGDEYYHCCPSGWTKTHYNDPNPCSADRELYGCGPPPAGVDPAQIACCIRERRWMPKDPSGQDPCAPKIVRPEEMLAPDVEIPEETLITPGMLAAAGTAVILLIVITVVSRKR